MRTRPFPITLSPSELTPGSTGPATNPKTLQTKKAEDALRLLFGNVNGLTPSTLNTLQLLTTNEHLVCLNELNIGENDTSLLSKIGNSVIKSLDEVTFKDGNRVQPTKTMPDGTIVTCRKRSGYGTAVIENLPGTKLFKTKKNEEIVGALVTLEGFNGLFITGYRSPSSRNETDILNFYITIQEIITNHLELQLDLIMFIGDDNASSTSNSTASKSAAAKARTIFSKFNMIDMLTNINTRGDKQPDSCYCYYNPENLIVNVSTIGTILGDHEAIQVEIIKDGIIPLRPKYKKFAKRILDVTDEERDLAIELSTDKWVKKWENNIKPEMPEKQINNCANGLVESLNKISSLCFKRKVVMVPVDVMKTDSAFNLEIIQHRARLAKMCHNIQNDPQSIEKRTQFRDEKLILDEIIKKATLHNFEKQMEEQKQSATNINWKSFFNVTGALLNKSSYQTRIEQKLTDEELIEKLDGIDKTFKSSDPEVDVTLESWKRITPEAKLSIVYEQNYIGETVRSLKKVSSFWTGSYLKLAKPLSILMHLIRANDYFPEKLRSSKCSFIGVPPKDRAVFSLEFLEKFTETVIQDAINVVKTEDGTMQTAYTKKRGTISCNAITLQCVETANEPVVQTQQDGIKAFNTIKRSITVEQAQLKYGAGRLYQTWFTRRSYLYKTMHGQLKRGQEADQGTMPGTILGVEGFSLFIATMIALTGKNKDLLWPSFYADDTGPLFLRSKLDRFKASLLRVKQWCLDTGVRFHLTGDKKPVYLAYLKKGEKFDDECNTMELCGTPITRVDSIVTLGLMILVRKMDCNKCAGCINNNTCNKNKNPGKTIDKYRYECQWNLGKIKMIAYRLQRLQHMISPEYMKNMVSCYLCSYITYSAAIIWPRSSEEHKKTTRYYYSMAMAACLSLSAAEALNLSSCKNTSVTEHNRYFEQLIEETGLPTIREMAGKNSVSTLRQIQGMKPEWFTQHTRANRSRKTGLGWINGVTRENFGTLIHVMYNNARSHLFDLEAAKEWRNNALDKISEKYDEHDIEFEKMLKTVDTPYLERFYLAEKVCVDNNNFSHTKVFNTFLLSSRLLFGCLDPASRVGNMKTPLATIIDKPSGTYIGTPSKRPLNSESSSQFNFNRLRNHKISCNFCDHNINFEEFSVSVNKSHLLHDCEKVPNSSPLPRRSKDPRRLMKRLMHIQDSFEPDGKKMRRLNREGIG